MDKNNVLDEIFNDDPFNLLIVKPKNLFARTPDERLLASFQEVNDFVTKQGKEPGPNVNNVAEFQLYSRLKSLREDAEKTEMLKAEDKHNLLPDFQINGVSEPHEAYNKNKPKEITSIEDILNDDGLNILGNDDEGLFTFKHTPNDYERAEADFVARRKPCKNFEAYESLFQQVQSDLASSKRILIQFKEKNLQAGDFYVHNGILLLLENVEFEEERERKDGRTRCIFENGTESNMLYRSLYKALLINGKAVTQNIDQINESFREKFNNISSEDEETGFIYILRSKSTDESIRSIKDLYKIGYSKIDIEERIKKAEQEPTYLMAPVSLVTSFKCYNLNPQKMEQLLHNFFGASCLNVDIFDSKGQRHTPREWFIAPLIIIEQAVELIINGKIVQYKYDPDNEIIVKKLNAP